MKKRLTSLTPTLALAGFLGATGEMEAGSSGNAENFSTQVALEDGSATLTSVSGVIYSDDIPSESVLFSLMDDQLNPRLSSTRLQGVTRLLKQSR